MTQLSEHFTAAEFACPMSGLVRVSNRLLGALEKLRTISGDRKIFVTRGGGCRSWDYNQQLVKTRGASPNSEHLVERNAIAKPGFMLEPRDCRAADIHIEGLTVPQMYWLALSVPDFNREGGIGVYPQNGFIHVDVRGHAARWMWKDGGYLAIPEGYAEDPGIMFGVEEQIGGFDVAPLLDRAKMAAALIENGAEVLGELGQMIANLLKEESE